MTEWVIVPWPGLGFFPSLAASMRTTFLQPLQITVIIFPQFFQGGHRSDVSALTLKIAIPYVRVEACLNGSDIT